MKDKGLRVFVKATSWRVIATCDTILLAWFFTNQMSSAFKIGISEVVTKIGLFYLHERMWERLNFGRVLDAEGNVEEKHYRSVMKGISWRFFGTMDTILLALFWTGDIKKAFAIGTTEIITKVGLFWLHERVWLKVKWGKKDSQEEVATDMAESPAQEDAIPEAIQETEAIPVPQATRA